MTIPSPSCDRQCVTGEVLTRGGIKIIRIGWDRPCTQAASFLPRKTSSSVTWTRAYRSHDGFTRSTALFSTNCAPRWGITARMRFYAATGGGRGLFPRGNAPLPGLIGSGYNESVY